MAKNNGVPDWRKMLDYNLIDHESKQRFLREENPFAGISTTGEHAGRASLAHILRQLQDAYVNPEHAIAEQEAHYVKAALEKRFGSYPKAVEDGVVLAVIRRKWRADDSTIVMDHRYRFMDDGYPMPLIDIRITMIHDEFSIDFTSHVGTLKL